MIRPDLTTGWGIEVKGSQLHPNLRKDMLEHGGFETLYDKLDNFSYREFYDFTQENHLMPPIDPKWVTRMDMDYTGYGMRGYIGKQMCIIESKKYDFNDENFDSEDLFVIFLNDWRHLDQVNRSSHDALLGQIEFMNPQSLQSLESFAMYPRRMFSDSPYSVVEKGTLNFANKDKDSQYYISAILAGDHTEVNLGGINTDDEEKMAILATRAGFNNAQEIFDAYEIIPNAEKFAFAQYLEVFRDNDTAKKLRPMLLYSFS